MKKLLALVLMFVASAPLWAQGDMVARTQKSPDENRNFRTPLLGEDAPSFTVESTNGVINFPADYGRKWKILFSHPQDFTPVCSSELIELSNAQSEFKKLGAEIVVVSIDPTSTHKDWIKALEGTVYKGKATEKIKFPLIGDDKLVVAKKYGMISSTSNSSKAVRGVFVISPDDKVVASYFYPNNVGRNIDEILRTLTALQVTARENLATPADWKYGEDLMVPVPPVTDQTRTDLIPDGYYKVNWFMWYKQDAAK